MMPLSRDVLIFVFDGGIQTSHLLCGTGVSWPPYFLFVGSTDNLQPTALWSGTSVPGANNWVRLSSIGDLDAHPKSQQAIQPRPANENLSIMSEGLEILFSVTDATDDRSAILFSYGFTYAVLV